MNQRFSNTSYEHTNKRKHQGRAHKQAQAPVMNTQQARALTTITQQARARDTSTQSSKYKHQARAHDTQ